LDQAIENPKNGNLKIYILIQLKELLELGDNNFNQNRCTSTQTIQGNTKPDSVKNQLKYRESRYKPIYSKITPINALTPTLTKIAITTEHTQGS